MSEILERLQKLYNQRGDEIEAWFGKVREQMPPFITNSVDLRHSGNRIVPVDTNLFPAGFHNLSAAARARAVLHMRQAIHEVAPAAKNILIVPENHTRNLAYLENLVVLRALVEQAGFTVRLGSLAAQDQPIELTTPSGETLVQEPWSAPNGKAQTASGFTPDLILLNNDLTGGMHPLLEGLQQPIIPPPSLGWWRRRKSVHFTAYRALAEEFCTTFGLDPWLISAVFYQCGMIDFRAREGLDCLAKGVDCVLAEIQKKYDQYGIKDTPYVFVKADSGTYGMGIMTARSGSEMLDLNKKERNKMQVIKEGTVNSEVIIQEGIPSIDTVDGAVAEPMIYLVDGVPVGGMYRFNRNRDAFNNLNATGMEFTGMCDEHEDGGNKVKMEGCHFRSFGLVASLAALAVPREEILLEEGYGHLKNHRTEASDCAQA